MWKMLFSVYEVNFWFMWNEHLNSKKKWKKVKSYFATHQTKKKTILYKSNDKLLGLIRSKAVSALIIFVGGESPCDDLVYLRFSSISRFSAECDRLVPPVPKTRLTFVRTRRRAVSVNLFVGHSPSRRMEESFIGTKKETIDQIAETNSKFSSFFFCLFVYFRTSLKFIGDLLIAD